MPQPLNKAEVKRGVGKLDAKNRGSKEIQFSVELDGHPLTRITVPKGRDQLPIGTYKGILKQTGLSESQMRDLCSCRINLADFLELWRAARAAGAAHPAEHERMSRKQPG